MVKKKKTAQALISILMVSMLSLATDDSQPVVAEVQYPPPTLIVTATGEPPPAEQDDTTNPAPPQQIGQHEYDLPESNAAISPNVNTFRLLGNHRKTHIFHPKKTNPKLAEAIYDLSIPNTVFKQIGRQYCQHLDIPPPHA